MLNMGVPESEMPTLRGIAFVDKKPVFFLDEVEYDKMSVSSISSFADQVLTGTGKKSYKG